MQTRHTIGERIYSGEPIVDFRRQIVGYGLHLRDVITRYSDIEE